jgi:DNA-binding protein Fis
MLKTLPTPTDFFNGLKGRRAVDVYHVYKKALEQELATAAICHYCGNHQAAARGLGITTSTLRRIFNDMGVTPKQLYMRMSKSK